ncbi:YcaO-like family protein [Dactylosporangium sp. NPDC051541]|uniref:YcaO-like family protein n=1 Tax=Dactylosporangium sp. NPDC051541 TaxID=3363977 RepID=UPI0037B57C18
MGLLLGPGAYYAETLQGAHILSHEGEFAFTGGSVYRLLDRLAPVLNGQYTLDELTAQLTPERKVMVRDLITALVERSVIRDIERADDTDAGPAGHEHEVTFTGYFRGAPATVVREYQNTPTLVLGAGELSAAVVAAAASSGLREVRVVTTSECGGATGDVLAGPQAATAIESLLDGVQLVLHATDGAMVGRARLLDRLCGDRNIWLAQALVIDGHAWMTSRPGDSWTAGWRRAEARRPGTAGPSQPAGPDVRSVSAMAVAAQMVHGVFQSITQPAERGRSRMVRVDLSTLASETATFLPHPYSEAAEPATDIVDRIGQLRRGARLTDEEFSQRAAACVGDLVGVFGNPVERDFAQQPLHVCAIEVADPVGLLPHGGPTTTVTGAGLDFATARWRAARRAFAVYASLMVDPRRFISGPLGEMGLRADPDELLLAVRKGAVTGLVPGYGLADGASHLVDAPRVFPAIRRSDRPYAPSPGVAVGYDWDEAVTAGLVGQGRSLTIGGMHASTTPFPLVDLVGAALDSRGNRYRALLAATGLPVTVYDVTGPLGVPTMVGCIGSVAAGCGSSLSRVAALTDTLEDVLLHHQAQSNRQSVYAPPPVAGIPPGLRGTDKVQVAGAAGDATAAAVISALVEHGHNPIAVPLVDDRGVNAVMPYAVHVVVSG